MKKLTDIRIGKDQYLSKVLLQIEINIILFKFLCGIGATKLELDNKVRSSLLILPNRPVIEGKCAKYNKNGKKIICGVYEGVSVDDIVDYLESNVTPKKIMTTPESFPKVMEAFDELDMVEYAKQNYMILFDECERAIQDVSYRKLITLPMKDFFKFTNKAFLSATPILPSDPRFEKNSFRLQYVKPRFKHQQNIELLLTNNVMFTFKRHVESSTHGQYFIFFNSTNAIATLIDFMGIRDESAIFCSPESRNKLRVNKFPNVFVSLKAFKKYNFFTSRFFSAVDIDGIINPNIIILTDLFSAEHSMVDPLSESIQIVGRFRRPEKGKITKTVTHITNVNPKLEPMTEETILRQIDDYENLHRVLRRFKHASDNATVRNALDEMMKRAEFAKYINLDGSKNYYMQDNTIYHEKTKGFYQSQISLKQAYIDSKHFNTAVNQDTFEYTDADRQRLASVPKLQTTFEIIMPILKELFDDSVDITEREQQIEALKKQFPEVMSIFKIVGFERAKELNFDPKKLRKEEIEVKRKSDRTNFGFIRYIEDNFAAGKGYTSTQIIITLKKGIDKFNLVHLKPNLDLLREYCQISKRCWLATLPDGRNVLGYKIVEIYDVIKS